MSREACQRFLIGLLLLCVFGSWSFSAPQEAGSKDGQENKVQLKKKDGPADPKELKNDPEDEPLQFFDTHQGCLVRAAVGIGFGFSPYGAAAVRLQTADSPLLWPEWQLTNEFLLPLRQDWLNDIIDDRPMPVLNAKSPKEIPKSAMALYQAYSQAMVNSLYATQEMFDRAAAENKHVTFSHLWLKPNFYRGKVIPLRGRLIKLVKHDAAPVPALMKGVKQYYEGWVVGPTKDANPFVIVFLDAPEGLEPADRMRKNIFFEGYFLTKFRYLADHDTTKQKLPPIAPILIGKTITVEEKRASADEEPYSRTILLYSLLGILLIVVCLLAMGWWFRRADRATRAALVSLRDKSVTFEVPQESPPPLATPVAPPRQDEGGIPPPSLN